MPGLEVLSINQFVIAHSQESEIVRYQPLQECDRFRGFARGQRMWIACKLLDQAADSRQHRFPIVDRTTYFFQHLRDRCDDGVALGIILDPLDMKMDKAFAALQLRTRAECDETTCIIAGNVDYRMGNEAHRDFSFRDIRQDGRNEEWHVVIDDLQDRDGVATVALAMRFTRQPDFWLARLSRREKRPGRGGKGRELARVVARHVLWSDAVKQSCKKFFLGGQLVELRRVIVEVVCSL